MEILLDYVLLWEGWEWKRDTDETTGSPVFFVESEWINYNMIF